MKLGLTSFEPTTLADNIRALTTTASCCKIAFRNNLSPITRSTDFLNITSDYYYLLKDIWRLSGQQ